MTNDNDQNIQNDVPNQGKQGQFHGDANAPVTAGDQNTVANQSVTADGDVKNVRKVTLGAGGTYIEGREQPKPHQLRAPVADFVGRRTRSRRNTLYKLLLSLY